MIHELLLALFGFEGDVFLTDKDSGHMKAIYALMVVTALMHCVCLGRLLLL